MITSDEWAGKLFVLLLVLNTQEGKDILGGCVFTQSQDIVLPAALFDDSIFEQSRVYQDNLDSFVEKYNRSRTNRRTMNSATTTTTDSEDPDHLLPQEDPNFKPKEPMEEALRKCSFGDFIELAEALLCFHAWYRLDAVEWFSKINSDDDRKEKSNHVRDSIRKMLAMVKCYMPRKSGLGWSIQKFHDLLHVAVDIERFGSPKNFDAGPLESSLRFWAKKPASTAQTRGYNTFLKQTSQRLHEYHALFKARRESGIMGVLDKNFPTLGPDGQPVLPEKPNPLSPPEVGGTHIKIFDSRSSKGNYIPTVYSRRGKKDEAAEAAIKLYAAIENFLRSQDPTSHDYFAPSIDQKTGAQYWSVFTECQFPLPVTTPRSPRHSGLLHFCCHPDFQQEGPWYDWAIVDYYCEEEDNKKSKKRKKSKKTKQPDEVHHNSFFPEGCVPAKVLAFVQNDEGRVVAIVHPCEYQTRDEKEMGSVLLEHWSLSFTREAEQPKEADFDYILSAKLYAVEIASIYDRCFVVEESPGIKSSIEVLEEKDPNSKRGQIHRKGRPPRKNKSKRKNQLELHSAVLLVRHREIWGQEFI
jgi:hypothetical protein